MSDEHESIPSSNFVSVMPQKHLFKGGKKAKGKVKPPSRHGKIAKTKKGKLQMGKMASGTFSLDFRAPFTPIQAFFVALAHLEE